MKLKIKVKRINKNLPMPEIIKKGDWIDLRASRTVSMIGPQAGTLKYHQVGEERVGHRDVEFHSELIPLGIAVELPKGLEAIVVSRSGTFKNFKIILTNGIGVIDYTYKGDQDEWKFNALAFADTVINEGDRIAQFRIQLSQKSTVWHKLKWLLSSGIKLVEVKRLGNPDRKGIGSTGVK